MKIQDLAHGTRFIYCNQLFIKIEDKKPIAGYTAAYNTTYPPIVTYIKNE